jgi:hypothetical protein
VPDLLRLTQLRPAVAAPRGCPFDFAYTTAFANFANLKKYYIDDLRGAGIHISRTAKARIEGESSGYAESDAAIRRLLFRRLNADKL